MVALQLTWGNKNFKYAGSIEPCRAKQGWVLPQSKSGYLVNVPSTDWNAAGDGLEVEELVGGI